MSKVFGVILLILSALGGLITAVTEEQCKRFYTKDRHCLLESGTWQRESNHIKRYVYDWGARRCVVWHWWTDPTRCSIPVDENHFGTEQECLNACSGWA